MKLILASGSPRRAGLLAQIGLTFEQMAPEVDETRYPDEEPSTYVERVARAKVAAVARPEAIAVAGDTAVVWEGRVFGKPGHPAEAFSMLRRLQGARHDVMTGVAAAGFLDGELQVQSLVDVVEVEMMPMTEEEIADYVAGGEPLDKAGGYALQGAGGRFVRSVQGSPFTVVGLPIHLLDRLCTAVGASLTSLVPPVAR